MSAVPTFKRGEWEDIGHGQRMRRVYRDGVLEAIDWDHSCTVVNQADYIWFGGQHGWELVAAQPLEVSPSLLCRACGVHGFIRNGRWQPC